MTVEPARARVFLMHHFYPDDTLPPPHQGFPSGSDNWASAGLTWTLIVFLVLVAARRRAERCTGGSPRLLAPSCLGMFCLPSLGNDITAEQHPPPPPLFPSSFINLPLKRTTEGSFKNHEGETLQQSFDF